MREYKNVRVMRGRRGQLYYYYRVRWTENGKERESKIRMRGAGPGCLEFEKHYSELSKPESVKEKAPEYSVAALCYEFRRSPKWAKISDRTREDYDYYMSYLIEKVGNYDARKIKRSDILKMRDGNAHRPRHANYCVAVMRLLMRHALDLDWRTDNPAADRIDKLALTGEGNPAWSEAALKAVYEAADPTLRLAIDIASSIGTRPGDLRRLTWDAFDGEAITYRQQKTGKEVWAPLLPRMQQRLEAAQRIATGETMLGDKRGKPLGEFALTGRLRMAKQRAGVTERLTMHGLRRNASVALARAGCTKDQIKAITGHETDVMIELYTERENRRADAKAAIEKLRGESHAT